MSGERKNPGVDVRALRSNFARPHHSEGAPILCDALPTLRPNAPSRLPQSIFLIDYRLAAYRTHAGCITRYNTENESLLNDATDLSRPSI
jgi:hypothetical protein